VGGGVGRRGVDRAGRVAMTTRTTTRAKRSSSEAVAWLLFSAGGVVSALLAPVLLLLFGIVIPLRVATPDYAHVAAVLDHPLTRLVLLVLCVLALLHWAHRFRYALAEGLQLTRLRGPITLLCYGAALAGSAWAAVVLLG
jgi:fumarate reductase subunit D